MASKSVNTCILLGRLGRDAESGNGPTKFSIATERRWKDKATGEKREETDWHNVVAWNLQTFIVDGLTKGASVYVSGRLQTRSYEPKDGSGKRYVTEVVADEVILLGNRSERAGGGKEEDSEETQDEDFRVPF